MTNIEDNIGIQYHQANTRFDLNETLIATFDSISDVDNFCSKYNSDNGYGDLKICQKIQINDGKYNQSWYIAGFDLEYKQKASDGSVYDNGCGILLLPEYSLQNSQWNTTSTTNGYINSYIHKTSLVSISNNLYKILGSHMINRNVLLSSSCNSNGPTSYSWTKSYCVLPALRQMYTGQSSIDSIYNIGDATYMIPLHFYIDLYYSRIGDHWLRDIDNSSSACYISSYGGASSQLITRNAGMRPTIYIR